MTDRRDEGYAVRPVRIGDPGAGGGRRGRRLGVAVVLLVAVGIVAIGWIGPRLESAPHLDIAYFATPTPDPNVSPSTRCRPRAARRSCRTARRRSPR